MMNCKKSIVIVTREMIIGGIEKSLISLMKKIPQKDFNITLLLERKSGEFLTDIPKYVHVQEIPGINSNVISLLLKKSNQVCFLDKLKAIYENKKGTDFWNGNKNYTKILPKILTQYDFAIAYSSPVSLATLYVINNINAKKKYIWIHNEVDKISVDISKCNGIYDKYDKIFCVSKLARKKLLDIFPEYTNKTDIFYNFINIDEIMLKAKEDMGFDDKFNGKRILTVGRICSQKGQDIIPDIVRKLASRDLNFRWYCIGEGEDTKKIIEKIKLFGLKDRICLLGPKKNPYPYFKECDIYVQPSRHEGFGLTISEAKCFNKPIVSTYFAGIDEQIDNKVNGFITNFDVDEIADMLFRLLTDKELSEKVSKHLLLEQKINARGSMEQLMRILE